MRQSRRFPRSSSTVALAALLGVLAAAPAAASDLRNVTTGGPLRPGIYGRIEVRGTTPPPVIYSQPVLAGRGFIPATARPVYLYVPPGQVRKWKDNCARWSACDQPVLFIRVQDSPSRWGEWRQFRDQLALHD
ncbi:hypothetical protein LZ009_10600 [Ramlibacter sp. XY19]|uniref:hypothetical protein n=1 Tax=Ramlibacter paludis TaxID=2908000 RepID=UPI0023DA8DA3|nr:hypothetical protein [Ramlibacter paludis]MCG2593230.1 hypothetical protein [Ramlibacter paludis]